MAEPNKASKSTRVRDNQRRSRARRKEYIEDLERRLQKFEKLGVQATLEVQAAGRQVVEENVLLRSLLRLRGVADEEVENFVKLHREGNRSSALTTRHPSLTPRPPLAAHLSGSSSDSGAENDRFEPAQLYPQADTLRSKAQNEYYLPAGPAKANFPSNSTINIDRPPTPNPSNSCSTATAAPTQPCCEQQASNNDLEMGQVTSCETAARIITMMRGYPDTQEARAELGCPSEQSCVVKNMTIFDLLDR